MTFLVYEVKNYARRLWLDYIGKLYRVKYSGNNVIGGRELWSSGNGWCLMCKRSWVQILAPYTGWTFGHFFTSICCKKLYCLFEKTESKNEKEAGVGPVLIKKQCHRYIFGRPTFCWLRWGSWALVKTIRVGWGQCDQIGRFIGLSATF